MKKRQDIYDLYWYFACERQNIFWKKLNAKTASWTDDEILQRYKFCNSYQVNDRVSQYLLRNVIYNGKKYSQVLENAISNEAKIYNDAYISCATKAFGYNRKHDNHLALLNKMFSVDKIYLKIKEAKTMKDGFNILRKYPLIGDYMAYQLVTDINYSDVVNWQENEFTIAGPGSLRGIKKCFIDKESMSNEDIIRYIYENQDKEFKRLGLNFERIGNRPLQLINCQNIFCELDKYCRQARPELKTDRTKIKKKYIAKNEKINYIYPPKWNI